MSNEQISKRETEILKLITAGRSNQEIANQLYISLSTVKKHREHLMRKFKAHNVIQLISNAKLSGVL